MKYLLTILALLTISLPVYAQDTHTLAKTSTQLDTILQNADEIDDVLDTSSGSAVFSSDVEVNGDFEADRFAYTDLTLTPNSGLNVSTDTSVVYLSGNMMAIQISMIFSSAITLTNGALIFTVSGLPTDLETRTYRTVMDGDTTAVRYSFACDLIVTNGSGSADIRLYWQDGTGLSASVDNITGLYGGGAFLLRKK